MASSLKDRGIRLMDITDGVSSTVGFSEAKAFSTYLASLGYTPPNPPDTPADLLTHPGLINIGRGHSSWAEAVGVFANLTFVFPPNTAMPYYNPADGVTYDVDWGCIPSAAPDSGVDYAAFIARSYHAGGVNAMLMDGSVRFVTNSIPRETWWALGTRNGGEPVAMPD
jgi:prepilin-type processing-associated H-X9-DG protein